VAVAWFLVQSGEVVGQLLSGLGIVVLASILYYMATRCDQVQRDRLLVVLVLTLFSMVFWSFFEQAGSSINLFTDRNVDRTIWGRETPASIYQSVNPAFILLLAPLFSMLWLHLARAGREPSTPIKFSLGLLQLGLGFGVLYLGASSAVPHGGIVPLGWLIAGYFLHTTGELCLSPVGLSMVTKLSPAHIMGLMMGTWFLATSFSQYIAGLIAKLTGIPIDGGQAGSLPPPSETVMIYGDVFGKIALTAIAASLVALLVAPWLRKRMHGIH
jgi:POT family proton-dependent oligopeptide transporter